jgi:hypothetical protein
MFGGATSDEVVAALGIASNAINPRMRKPRHN